MTEFAKSIVGSLESGQAVTLVTLAGSRELPSGWLGRKIVIAPGRRILVGTLGSAALDRRVLAECPGEPSPAAGTKLLSLSLTAEECEQLGAAPGTEVRLLIDTMAPGPLLLIVGAGHIAQPLCAMAKTLGFTVAVLDDRDSFANRERFPEADRILVGGFTQELGRFPINRSTYVVIVTRGHAYDEGALRAVVGSDAAYLGMIGSRRKVLTVLDSLARSGVPAEQLGRVCSPIGLDIGAESPAEIALSILAEMVNVRRRGGLHPSSLARAVSTGVQDPGEGLAVRQSGGVAS